MSEVPTQYHSKGPNKNDLVRVAHFMNGFLGFEIFKDMPRPESVKRNYDDLDDNGKLQWLEYAYWAIFKDATMGAADLLGRGLRKVEKALIQRRIMNYFKQNGIDYKK
jgi:hypothetical protein